MLCTMYSQLVNYMFITKADPCTLLTLYLTHHICELHGQSAVHSHREQMLNKG